VGGRAAAQARAAYSAGLPPRYTGGAHAAALGAARGAFWAAAAGPAAGAAAAALERACAAEWARRRRCEAASLTGRPCRLAPHGPDVAHVSGARMLTASEDGTTRWRPTHGLKVRMLAMCVNDAVPLGRCLAGGRCGRARPRQALAPGPLRAGRRIAQRCRRRGRVGARLPRAPAARRAPGRQRAGRRARAPAAAARRRSAGAAGPQRTERASC